MATLVDEEKLTPPGNLECTGLDHFGDGKGKKFLFKMKDYIGSFILFLFCPDLVDENGSESRDGALDELRAFADKGDVFKEKNCIVFAVVKDKKNGEEFNLDDIPSVQLLIDEGGKVSKSLLGTMTREDPTKQMEKSQVIVDYKGMVRHSITIHNKSIDAQRSPNTAIRVIDSVQRVDAIVGLYKRGNVNLEEDEKVKEEKGSLLIDG